MSMTAQLCVTKVKKATQATSFITHINVMEHCKILEYHKLWQFNTNSTLTPLAQELTARCNAKSRI